MSNQSKHTTNNPFDIFIIGARKGFTIATNNLVPNILMAYAVAEVLRILGVMQFIGDTFFTVLSQNIQYLIATVIPYIISKFRLFEPKTAIRET